MNTLMNPAMNVMIQMQHITKTYRLGQDKISILQGINLSINHGEFVAIMGTSGSGKSTLINIMGCLDQPSSGSYRLVGKDLTTLNKAQLAYIRNQQIGFVFQQFNLLPHLTALENVMLPMVYANVPLSERQKRASLALTRVGLANRLSHVPNQLSGGQQQRVAIARALVNHPALILADEPTGALDSHTTQDIIQVLTELNQQGITIVIVTHEQEVAAQAQRVIHIQDGNVIKVVPGSRWHGSQAYETLSHPGAIA